MSQELINQNLQIDTYMKPVTFIDVNGFIGKSVAWRSKIFMSIHLRFAATKVCAD
jgi:hypothetical protein